MKHASFVLGLCLLAAGASPSLAQAAERPEAVGKCIAALRQAAPFSVKFAYGRFAYNYLDATGVILYRDDTHFRTNFNFRFFPALDPPVGEWGNMVRYDGWSVRNGDMTRLTEPHAYGAPRHFRLAGDWRVRDIAGGHLLFDSRASLPAQVEFLIDSCGTWAAPEEVEMEKGKAIRVHGDFDWDRLQKVAEKGNPIWFRESRRAMHSGLELLIDPETFLPIKLRTGRQEDNRNTELTLSDFKKVVALDDKEFAIPDMPDLPETVEMWTAKPSEQPEELHVPANVSDSFAALKRYSPFCAQFFYIRWAFNPTIAEGAIIYQDDAHYRLDYEEHGEELPETLRVEEMQALPATHHILVADGGNVWHEMWMEGGAKTVEKLPLDWRDKVLKEGDLLLDFRAPLGPQLQFLIGACRDNWKQAVQEDGCIVFHADFDEAKLEELGRDPDAALDPHSISNMSKSIRSMCLGMDVAVHPRTGFPMQVITWLVPDTSSVLLRFSDVAVGGTLTAEAFTFDPPADAKDIREATRPAMR